MDAFHLTVCKSIQRLPKHTINYINYALLATLCCMLAIFFYKKKTLMFVHRLLYLLASHPCRRISVQRCIDYMVKAEPAQQKVGQWPPGPPPVFPSISLRTHPETTQYTHGSEEIHVYVYLHDHKLLITSTVQNLLVENIQLKTG